MITDKNPLEVISSDPGFTSIFRRIGVIGDSLSSGEHESMMVQGVKGFHDYYEYSWGQFIARACGSTVYNFSKGGLQAKTFFTDLIKKEGFNIFDESKKCECYIIALGVNDIDHVFQKDSIYSLGYGSLDDVDFNDYHNNKDSFIGWYVRIIQQLKEFSPKCRIFTISRPNSNEDPNSERYKVLKEFDEFLEKLNEHFEFIYNISLWKHAPKYTGEFYKKYFLGGHMNAMGYKITADIVMTYINFIINEKYEDFKQVGFINKDVHNINDKW